MKPLRVAFGVFVLTSAAAAATTKPSALFVYEQDGDTITFFSPRTVRIIHAATSSSPANACQYDLPENGNMLSGGDVERAFKDPVVQSELHAHHAYSSTDGKLTVGTDGLQWSLICRGACVTEPVHLQQLHQSLRTVMLNARLVCP